VYYEINEENEVRGWSSQEDFDNGKPPILLQPSWPDWTPWSNAEATEWADSWVAFETGSSDIIPKSSPSSEERVREDESLFVLDNGDKLTEANFRALFRTGWMPGEEYPEGTEIVL
jgi:hypothetical protein